MMDTEKLGEVVSAAEKKMDAVTSIDWWMWIAVVEFLLIVFLLFVRKRQKRGEEMAQFKEEAISNEIDFDNVLDSSFNAALLYDELKKKCHPDRFPNDVRKNRVATELSLEIAKNKNNVKRLRELKREAVEKLGVKF